MGNDGKIRLIVLLLLVALLVGAAFLVCVPKAHAAAQACKDIDTGEIFYHPGKIPMACDLAYLNCEYSASEATSAEYIEARAEWMERISAYFLCWGKLYDAWLKAILSQYQP